MHIMHTGSPGGVTLLQFDPPEGGVPPEIEVPEVPEDQEEEVELPECPDDQPTNFVKDKPRSIPKSPPTLFTNALVFIKSYDCALKYRS
jgi:hypothetical protein